MKTPVLVFAIVLIVSLSYAQSQETGIGYFTKEWLQTKSPTAAAYYRTIQINSDSSAYILRDYFVPSGKYTWTLNAEDVRVIGAMKAWKPAMIRGKAVKSRFVLPIKFKLA